MLRHVRHRIEDLDLMKSELGRQKLTLEENERAAHVELEKMAAITPALKSQLNSVRAYKVNFHAFLCSLPFPPS
jgi:hypothetical protein